MKSVLFLFFALLFQPAISVFILLPLYIYPYNDAGDFLWQPVLDIVSAHPLVHWQIIVNPDSGPGSTAYPDSDYITAVAKLHKFKNVKLVGYVDTAYMDKATSKVKAEITRYAGWAKYKPENISVSGIFFDDVVDTASGTKYMSTVSGYAYTSFPKKSGGAVIFNPGTYDSPEAYYKYADTVINFEDAYASYDGAKTIGTFPSKYKSQEAVITHDALPTAKGLQTVVNEIYGAGLGGVYLTSDCCYNALNATLLKDLVADLATAQAKKG